MNPIEKNQYLAEGEMEIDLADLLGQILIRWKFVALCLLICAVLGCGFAFFRASGTEPAAPAVERIQSAHDALTEEQAATVESLLRRSVIYQTYRSQLQENLSQYMTSASQADDFLVLYANYYLFTSMDRLEEVLPESVLSVSDYEALQQVLADEQTIRPLEKIVNIQAYGWNNGFADSEKAGSADADYVEIPSEFMIQITTYGDSEAQCQALFSIADAALQKYVLSLQNVDPDISLHALQQTYSPIFPSFSRQEITQNMSVISSVESQINNLNNQINKLSDAEKQYYDLLDAEEEANEESVVSGRHVSWKKWTVVGAFLGAVLGAGILLLQYIFDGKLKTADEAEHVFQTGSLQRIYLPGKKNLFGSWVARLRGVDGMSREVKTSLLSADLQLLLEKGGLRSLYLLCDAESERACALAEEVVSLLQQRDGSLQLSLGDPAASVSDLEAFSAAQAAVVFAELKRTPCKQLMLWRELCLRYQKPIAGTVTAEICW